ncbi:MAG TPA: SagB/ThcOx family dehydrogenase, partial [Epsilonproteobacteria bacterium]|nr:SagB/ThcOx family dehydrogenase [Campylobacterota bacterium]
MNNLYKDTSLTPMRVARMSGYIDWSSQPSLFKHYPRFSFSYPFGSIPELKVAEISRFITSESMIGGKPYYQLNTPSAGNLHPVELYIQIRGIKGVISGIYHVDSHKEALVLIREIEEDGIENAVSISNRFKGMIFIISIVPFRSEWKYGSRAIRYCYLDAGHQAASILSAAKTLGHNATILSDIDALSLNEQMGFTSQEYSALAIAIGEESEKPSIALTAPLMYVAPTDYWESVSRFTKELEYYKYTVRYPEIQAPDIQISSIYERRSARLFEDQKLSSELSEYFIKRMIYIPSPITTMLVVLPNASIEPGIYKNDQLENAGDYAKEITHILVDQKF